MSDRHEKRVLAGATALADCKTVGQLGVRDEGGMTVKLVIMRTWFGRAKVYVEDEAGDRFWLATFCAFAGADAWCKSQKE